MLQVAGFRLLVTGNQKPVTIKLITKIEKRTSIPTTPRASLLPLVLPSEVAEVHRRRSDGVV